MPGPPDRPSERPDAPVWPDASAADGRATWSRDDLRERLRRLPPGHPSSLERTAAAPSGQRLPADDHQSSPDRRVDRTVPTPPASRTRPGGITGARCQCSWKHGQRTSAPGRGAGRARSTGRWIRPARGAVTAISTWTRNGTPKPRTSSPTSSEPRSPLQNRLKEKIADLAETSAPDAPVEYVARQVPDAIRYTFCVEADDYALVCWAVKGQLEERGYSITYAENHWPREEYKGIKTRWLTSEGQRFELQFHTPESFHAKQQITHLSYERLRNPLTSEAVRETARCQTGLLTTR